MVRKPDIEYVDRFYVHGSEAKVVEFAPGKRTPKTTLPKPLKEKKTSIEIDPVALCGLVVAVAMLVVMAVGMVDFKAACEENQLVSENLQSLRDENVMKQYTYYTQLDMEYVEAAAEVMGMVSADKVTTIPIQVSVPAAQEKHTFWGDFLWSLSCLFAA